MNIVLWIVQGLLAVLYLMAGSMKAFTPENVSTNPQMAWAHTRPNNYIRFVGISELLGALGLILPLLTGILPWLTALAALGLTLVQVLAVFTVDLPKKEFNVIPMNVVLLALSVFIMLGRWPLFS